MKVYELIVFSAEEIHYPEMFATLNLAVEYCQQRWDKFIGWEKQVSLNTGQTYWEDDEENDPHYMIIEHRLVESLADLGDYKPSEQNDPADCEIPF